MVVTVEYRTGLLGFLTDETKKMPGNLAVSDVSLALSWVQQAIAEFGGNPQSVTLAGYGQGAVIAHLLSLNSVTSSKTCSKHSINSNHDLISDQFHKLILLSGSSMCKGSVALPYTVKSDLPSPYYTYKYTSLPIKKMCNDSAFCFRKVLTQTRCSDLRCLQDKSLGELMRAQTEIEVRVKNSF